MVVIIVSIIIVIVIIVSIVIVSTVIIVSIVIVSITSIPLVVIAQLFQGTINMVVGLRPGLSTPSPSLAHPTPAHMHI